MSSFSIIFFINFKIEITKWPLSLGLHNIHVISCFQSSSVIFHAIELNIVCRLYLSANSINYTCYVSAGVSSGCEILSVSPTQDTDYQNLVSIIHVDPVRFVID